MQTRSDVAHDAADSHQGGKQNSPYAALPRLDERLVHFTTAAAGLLHDREWVAVYRRRPAAYK